VSTTVAYAILAGVLGAAVGSFLNVVVYRLPRVESLISPPSHCPACAAPIKPYDNVPLLGWIWLRGRCRACRAPISPRYPLVEGGTAALCVAVVLTQSTLVRVVLGLVLVLVVVPVALIDLDHHIIPNRITVPGALAALALGSALDVSGEPERLIAGAAAAGFLLLAALAYPRGMGIGDVKLAGVIVGAAVIARTPPAVRRNAGLPFGPFLALGGLVGLFAGRAIVTAYLHAFS